MARHSTNSHPGVLSISVPDSDSDSGHDEYEYTSPPPSPSAAAPITWHNNPIRDMRLLDWLDAHPSEARFIFSDTPKTMTKLDRAAMGTPLRKIEYMDLAAEEIFGKDEDEGVREEVGKDVRRCARGVFHRLRYLKKKYQEVNERLGPETARLEWEAIKALNVKRFRTIVETLPAWKRLHVHWRTLPNHNQFWQGPPAPMQLHDTGKKPNLKTYSSSASRRRAAAKREESIADSDVEILHEAPKAFRRENTAYIDVPPAPWRARKRSTTPTTKAEEGGPRGPNSPEVIVIDSDSHSDDETNTPRKKRRLKRLSRRVVDSEPVSESDLREEEAEGAGSIEESKSNEEEDDWDWLYVTETESVSDPKPEVPVMPQQPSGPAGKKRRREEVDADDGVDAVKEDVDSTSDPTLAKAERKRRRKEERKEKKRRKAEEEADTMAMDVDHDKVKDGDGEGEREEHGKAEEEEEEARRAERKQAKAERRAARAERRARRAAEQMEEEGGKSASKDVGDDNPGADTHEGGDVVMAVDETGEEQEKSKRKKKDKKKDKGKAKEDAPVDDALALGTQFSQVQLQDHTTPKATTKVQDSGPSTNLPKVHQAHSQPVPRSQWHTHHDTRRHGAQSQPHGGPSTSWESASASGSTWFHPRRHHPYANHHRDHNSHPSRPQHHRKQRQRRGFATDTNTVPVPVPMGTLNRGPHPLPPKSTTVTADSGPVAGPSNLWCNDSQKDQASSTRGRVPFSSWLVPHHLDQPEAHSRSQPRPQQSQSQSQPRPQQSQFQSQPQSQLSQPPHPHRSSHGHGHGRPQQNHHPLTTSNPKHTTSQTKHAPKPTKAPALASTPAPAPPTAHQHEMEFLAFKRRQLELDAQLARLKLESEERERRERFELVLKVVESGLLGPSAVGGVLSGLGVSVGGSASVDRGGNGASGSASVGKGKGKANQNQKAHHTASGGGGGSGSATAGGAASAGASKNAKKKKSKQKTQDAPNASATTSDAASLPNGNGNPPSGKSKRKGKDSGKGDGRR